MKRPKPIDLDVIRAKKDAPHVRVSIDIWHLGGTRWYWEPETVGRVELRQSGREIIGSIIEGYGRDFASWKRPTPPKGARRVRARGRRR